jgi:mono/diheme cytochrome c family protein
MEPSDSRQAAREKPEPQERVRPMSVPLMVIAAILVTWCIYYIARSGPYQPPEWGDRRTVEDLAAKAQPAAGKIDGAAVYAARCVACHQPTGAGLPGVFPPLAGSEWVAAKAPVLIQIVLHGAQGPITVKGATFNGQMPPFGAQIDDAELAAVATYVRSQWGNNADAVTPAMVAEQRAATAARTSPWNGEADLAALR